MACFDVEKDGRVGWTVLPSGDLDWVEYAVGPRPSGILGLHHVALNVRCVDMMLSFYQGVLGMQLEWQPDPDNVYLTSGRDNLALHASQDPPMGPQRLDHLGFCLATPADVDAWYHHLLQCGVEMAQAVRDHRDGARSFYCYDPEGNQIQFIYHPPLAAALEGAG